VLFGKGSEFLLGYSAREIRENQVGLRIKVVILFLEVNFDAISHDLESIHLFLGLQSLVPGPERDEAESSALMRNQVTHDLQELDVAVAREEAEEDLLIDVGVQVSNIDFAPC
jgi:hypothetical protein